MSDDEEEVEFEKEMFDIGPFKLNITTISFMPLHKLMQLNSVKTEISGQKLWCGSLCLCEYLLNHPDVCAGKSVVELGAGTGVCSMLCSKLGATMVTMTDHDEKSLRHMTIDCADNAIAIPEAAHVLHLDWFAPDYSKLPIPKSSGANAAGDCTCEDVLVVAGDVIYKRELVEPFFGVVAHLARSYGASVLLCHIPRAGVEHPQVVAAAGAAGLQVVEVDANLWRKGVVVQYSPSDDFDRAKVYSISAASGSC